MKKTVCLLSMFFTIAYSATLSAQIHERLGILVRFDPGAPQDSVDVLLEEFSAVEKWISPLSETRYWKLGIDTFPYQAPSGTTYNVINDLILAARNRDTVAGSGLNYRAQTQPISSNAVSIGQNSENGATPPICIEDINNPNSSNTGLRIAILDTGLTGTVMGTPPVYTWNYVDNNINVEDLNGHGSTMTTIIANTFEKNSDYTTDDIEWDIRKTHDINGRAYNSEIIYAMEQAAVAGADIINMSFSHFARHSDASNEMLKYSVELLEQNNILVVASAGNKSKNNDRTTGKVAFPASLPTYNVISVGALNCTDESLALFSNYGHNTVDLVAPGVRIESINVAGSGLLANKTSGTSQATAFVSGAALALAAHQSAFDYLEVKCAILSGVDILPSLKTKILTSGKLNIDNAYDELLVGCHDTINTPVFNGSEGRSRIATNETAQEIEIFPNPANDFIGINNLEFDEKTLINIYNTSGQLVVKKEIKNYGIINIQTLPSGIYYIELLSDKKRKINKFIKE